VLLNPQPQRSSSAHAAANRFDARLQQAGLPRLARRAPDTLQVNMGRLCNQACHHCHVDAGPLRTEVMSREVVERILDVLGRSASVKRVDITGGAPEMNPNFRRLVNGSLALGRDVTVRCNLTVLELPGQEDTAEFFAARELTVVASLPCYTAENTDRQRGSGVFEDSVKALHRLNALGYGAARGDESRPGLRLHLVYNPLGPTLPPPQEQLEHDYRQRLHDDHGIVFDRLLTIANMPIHRFAEDLARQGRLDEYQDLLARSFNPRAVGSVMCRDLVSVEWNGRLSDCDFNQMLGLPLGAGAATIHDVDDLGTLADARVTTADHCLGCTAGQGSSCAGALTPPGAG
jgi:radical SAM/Cys-rich protein